MLGILVDVVGRYPYFIGSFQKRGQIHQLLHRHDFIVDGHTRLSSFGGGHGVDAARQFVRRVDDRGHQVRVGLYTTYSPPQFNVDGTRIGESRIHINRCLFANNSGKGYNARTSQNVVENSWFRDNRRGIFLFEGDKASRITRNRFSGNETPFRLGDFYAINPDGLLAAHVQAQQGMTFALVLPEDVLGLPRHRAASQDVQNRCTTLVTDIGELRH